MKEKILLSIVMGSESDLPVAQNTTEVLDEMGIGYEVRILSAHRSPDATAQYAKELERRGIEVVIALAGGAFHLAGVIASYTSIPVIAVPLAIPPFNGLDSLLSTLQMPRGVPVAVMAVGEWGARNAGIFAAEILSLKYPSIKESIKEMRERLRKEIEEKNRRQDWKK